MRIALARALFSKPDLLLLDEPTNMLDMQAVIWLERYLQTWPSTLLVVSHDRNFMDEVPTDMLHLHSQRIDTYRGNYTEYHNTMTEKLKAQAREYENQMEYRKHVQEFINKFRYNAKRAPMVQSRIKMLEKLPVLEPVIIESSVTLKFPEVEKMSGTILMLSEVSFTYSGTDRVIFSNVDLSATMESRICIGILFLRSYYYHPHVCSGRKRSWKDNSAQDGDGDGGSRADQGHQDLPQEPQVWLLHSALCGPAGHVHLSCRDHAERIPRIQGDQS